MPAAILAQVGPSGLDGLTQRLAFAAGLGKPRLVGFFGELVREVVALSGHGRDSVLDRNALDTAFSTPQGLPILHDRARWPLLNSCRRALFVSLWNKCNRFFTMCRT